jgi:ferredoxin
MPDGFLPRKGYALLACPKVPNGSLCLQALGMESLAQIWRSGVRALRLAIGDCLACENGAGLNFAERLAGFNQLLADRDLAPLEVTIASPSDTKRLPQLADPKDRPTSRRALFAGLAPSPKGPALAWLQNQPGPDPRHAISPRIDPEKCTGCDACTRICPEAALTLIKADCDKLAYHSNAAACTGCAMCVDVCEPNAVTLPPLTTAQPDLVLHSFRCKSCGVLVHLPAEQNRAADLCPICTKTRHASRLFVVIE